MTTSKRPVRGTTPPPDHPLSPAETGAGAKTSAAAAFALVFGVSALISVLTAILASVGLLLGIVGVVLGVAALKTTRRPGVTGRGVAIGGLVLSALAVLLALAVAAGISTFVNDEGAVDRLQERVENLRDDLPS